MNEVPSDLNHKAIYDALLHKRLDFFIGRVFEHLKPGDNFSFNWLVRAMAYQLTEVQNGNLTRLIFNIPPRHLKSICTSVAFPAFILGKDPTTTIILVCYSTELGEKMMRDLRSVVTSEWYRNCFPKTRLAKNSATEITTEAGGGVNMTSVHGTLTGRGARTIIVDDPIKAQDIQSDAERRRTNEWFQNTLFSRLDNKQTGAIIIAMQRLHEDDVTGYLTEDPQHRWRVVAVPAISEVTTTHPILRVGEKIEFIRHSGTVIDPEREDLETLHSLRRELGSLSFASQYQQQPLAREGNLVKRDWFRVYQDPPERFDAVLCSWDTASAAGDNNDYSVGTVWGTVDNKHYLLHVVRVRMEYPLLKRKITDVACRWQANLTLLEGADSGRNLFHDLRYGLKCIMKNPKGSKEDRLAACGSLIEDGRIILPAQASWKRALIDELVGFPNTRHDDQVDSVSMYLNHIRILKTPLKFDSRGNRIRKRRRRRGSVGNFS